MRRKTFRRRRVFKKPRYTKLRAKRYGFGGNGSGSVRRDFRPVSDGSGSGSVPVPQVGPVVDEGFNVDEQGDVDFGIVDRRRRLADEAFRRANDPSYREPGVRYIDTYGFY